MSKKNHDNIGTILLILFGASAMWLGTVTAIIMIVTASIPSEIRVPLIFLGVALAVNGFLIYHKATE